MAGVSSYLPVSSGEVMIGWNYTVSVTCLHGMMLT